MKENDKPRCGAKTRAGGTCRRYPLANRNRCRLHGGASPRGLASASWKTGEFSKALPQELAKRYRAMLTDTELINLCHEASLLDCKLLSLLEQTGKPSGSWDEVIKFNNDMDAAAKRNDIPASRAALNSMKEVIARADGERSLWKDIMAVIERKRRITDSIMRHRVAAAEVITLTAVNTLFDGLAKLIRRAFLVVAAEGDDHVKAVVRRELGAVSESFIRLATSTSGGHVN